MYEERRKESLKVMAETESRRAQIQETVRHGRTAHRHTGTNEHRCTCTRAHTNTGAQAHGHTGVGTERRRNK